MFSFIRKYAESLNGADIYPNIGIFFFMIVFLGMVWFALKADKGYIRELENMPIDDKN